MGSNGRLLDTMSDIPERHRFCKVASALRKRIDDLRRDDTRRRIRDRVNLDFDRQQLGGQCSGAADNLGAGVLGVRSGARGLIVERRVDSPALASPSGHSG